VKTKTLIQTVQSLILFAVDKQHGHVYIGVLYVCYMQMSVVFLLFTIWEFGSFAVAGSLGH